jgi:predicted dehydrogenase
MYGEDTGVYTNFEDFINHPNMDVVFIANFFNEHAACAIAALERGINVISECLANVTMAEGVALVRAQQKSTALYQMLENYPYSKVNQELARVYKGGTLGKALYCEGEYNHPIICNGKPAETNYIRPYHEHWRNHLPRTYYITHSLGPLMYVTGAMPKRVTAMPVFAPDDPDALMGLEVGDRAAIITVLNDDDSVFRVTGCSAFGAHEDSYRICGTKGQIENLRDGSKRVLLQYNKWDTPEGAETVSCYKPEWHDSEQALIEKTGHGGGDFFVVREFFTAIREDKEPIFDAYTAAEMSAVAILAHRSVLERGAPYDIPDFRTEEDRVKYENDSLTPFYGSDGSTPTLPACSHPDYKPKEEWIEEYQRIIKG